MRYSREDIGERLRTIRENKGLTQRDVCGDETQLSVRQLSRIETGSAEMSVSKLCYLCQQLGIATDELIYGSGVVSTDFVFIKQHLKYVENDSVDKKEDFFKRMYTDMYDRLQSNEKVVVDIFHAKYMMQKTGDVTPLHTVIIDQLDMLVQKTYYTYMDLCIIQAYFELCQHQNALGVYCETLAYQVLLHIDIADTEKLDLLARLIVSILEVLRVEKHLYFIETGIQLIVQTKQYQLLPYMYAFEGAYILYAKQDNEKALHSFDKAIKLAYLHQDDALAISIADRKNKIVT